MTDPFVQSLVEIIPAHLHKEMERELINGWRMRESVAKAEAKQIAHHGHTHEANDIAGFGRKVASIPADAYHYWGQRLGYECWKDKQFFREFLRDNPELAVRNYCKKTVVQGAVFTADGFKV
jgi:hypothetical protein